jgi:hypothetical protein
MGEALEPIEIAAELDRGGELVAASYALAGLAPATLRAYESDLRTFTAAARGRLERPGVPADPGQPAPPAAPGRPCPTGGEPRRRGPAVTGKEEGCV